MTDTIREAMGALATVERAVSSEIKELYEPVDVLFCVCVCA